MKTWNIQKTQFKVSDFVNWAKNDELELSPSFQRRAVWSKGAKSYLLDTILRGLPIPPIILRDLPPNVRTFKSKRQVVDGQQRLRTLLSFIVPQVLSDFSVPRDQFTISRTHSPELAGTDFSEFEPGIQQQILNYQFMVHVFPSETDDREILEIFARMNATGTKLNNQELRNANYFGEFKTRAFALAAEHLNIWRNWRLFPESGIARMAEVEFTSELMILVIQGISANSKSVIDKVYKSYDAEFPFGEEVLKRVRHILDLLDSKLLKDCGEVFALKGLVYPLFTAVYDNVFGLGSELASRRPRSVKKVTLEGIAEKATKILRGRAPKSVLLAAEARASQDKNRKILSEYLST